jgi:hypothetical protein
MGSVTGTVWIDTNGNGEKDAGEPAVPGVEVRIAAAVTSASATSANGRVSPAAESVTTNKKGSYSFVAVAVGRYHLTAAIPKSSGLGSTGVDVSVEAGSETPGDISAVGTAVATTLMWDPTRSSPIAEAKVTCTWNGVDGKAGTDDEVTFTGSTGPDGVMHLKNVPAGGYMCRGTNTASGNRSALVPMTVAKSASIPNTVSTKTQATVRIEIASGGLVLTGTNPERTVTAAMLLLMAGVMLSLTSRRRRRRTH